MFALILKVAICLLGLLPQYVLRLLARVAGRVGFIIARRRRKIALDNLKNAYGKKLSSKERKGIALESFISLAQTAVEFLTMPRFAGHLAERIDLHGRERLDELTDKGAMLVVAHLGNWEIGGAFLSEVGFRLNAIARPQAFSAVEDTIQNVRGKMGVRVILKKDALMESLRVLRRKEMLALLIDQHSRKNGVVVDFFGMPASTLASPAVLSVKTGSPVLPAFLIRKADGRFDGYIEPPIYPNPTGDLEADVLRLTQQYTRMVEKYVRMFPEQWMWCHRRWRPGERKKGK